MKNIVDKLIPASRFGSAMAAIVAVAGLTVAGECLSASFLLLYGWGLFVGMPFFLGMVAVLVYGYRLPRKYTESMKVCLYAVLLAGATLLGVAIEGLGCLIMAAPIALALALLGGTVAHALLRIAWWKHDPDKLLCAAVLAIPAFIGIDDATVGPAPLLCAQSTVDIRAAPQTVWRHVVTFNELPAERDWIFHTGVAYPIRAEIQGRGVGAVRKCVFSTGPFIEPIEVWDEPRLLKFSVIRNPEPMQEWSPYGSIQPPHLVGYMVSEAGQFLLTRNPDGSTHLEGTTWYRHHLYPAGYWQVWSDFIIHRIHMRVLNHVKRLAEKDSRQ